MKLKIKNNKGFTIVELLIVIVVIGILAALVLNAWRAPNQTGNSMVNSATPDKNHYGYRPLQDDGTTACTTAPCAKFKLYWYSEKDSTVTTKDSLN
jgi:prepilin-type N-terminal cleavage/methylation domain-containing protein